MAQTTQIQTNQEWLTRRAVHTGVLNPCGSKTFLKKLVPIAVSFILHQRIELEERYFSTHSYGGIKYHILKGNKENATLQQINEWIAGALDALEKDYLRELYLVIESSTDPGTMYESYKLQFKYMGKDVIPMETQTSNKHSLEDAMNCLLTAIESLNVYQLYKETEIKLKIALTYYKDVTPKSYAPPHFEIPDEFSQSICSLLEKQSKSYLHLGMLKTGYHVLKCRAKSEKFAINQSSSTESTNISTTSKASDRHFTECNVLEENSCNETDYVPVDTKTFNCLCNLSAEVDCINTILCSKCSDYQHSACAGYLRGAHVPDEYVCALCNGDRKKFSNAEKANLERISIFRLVVAVAYFSRQVPIKVLKMFPEDIGQFTFQKLIEHGVIHKENEKYKINLKMIKNIMLKALFSHTALQETTSISDSIMLDNESQSQPNSMVLDKYTYHAKKRKLQ